MGRGPLPVSVLVRGSGGSRAARAERNGPETQRSRVSPSEARRGNAASNLLRKLNASEADGECRAKRGGNEAGFRRAGTRRERAQAKPKEAQNAGRGDAQHRSRRYALAPIPRRGRSEAKDAATQPTRRGGPPKGEGTPEAEAQTPEHARERQSE